MKKISFYSLGALLVGASILTISWKYGNTDKNYKGEVDYKDFDTTVKPQQDFYMYVNGNWIKNNPIPASENSWGSFTVINDNVVKRLRTILEKVAADKSAQPGSLEQKVGDLYGCMMDSVNLNKQGIEPLKEELNKINAVSDNKSLWAEVARLQKIGPDVMFGFGVGQDAKISTKEICSVGQGGMSLPSKDYYTQDSPMMKNIRSKFVEYASALLKQAGESDDAAGRDAQKVLDIETQMASASMSRIEMRNVAIQYNKMTMKAFIDMSSNIDWATIQEVFGVKNIDSIIVSQPAFMKHLNEMTKSVSIDDWKTYMRFHLISSESGRLSDTLEAINFNFWGKTFQGVKEMQPRWKRSTQATSRSLGLLVGQLYVKQYFSPETKERVYTMVQNIIAAYKERIQGVNWMSPETKQYAIAKLDKIMLKLCYPDKWKDYSKLTIKRDSWVMNAFRISEFEFNFDIDKLGKPVDRTEWGMTPQTVNAYYNPSMNEIVFPASIMQPPFFDPDRDDAMNYGSMGAVIGHELTHGFDDQGSQFDANGNFHKWWTDADSTKFHNKLQVLINQFNNYEVDSLHVKGELTIGENTADLGGLTIAYYALENQLKQHPEGIVDGFTPEQRFFIAWAQAWRENMRPEYQKRLILTNPHSPNMFRANGPCSNMAEFRKAFDPSTAKGFSVKPGDGMYRADSSRAVIW